jgi:hypothetical protein
MRIGCWIAAVLMAPLLGKIDIAAVGDEPAAGANATRVAAEKDNRLSITPDESPEVKKSESPASPPLVSSELPGNKPQQSRQFPKQVGNLPHEKSVQSPEDAGGTPALQNQAGKMPALQKAGGTPALQIEEVQPPLYYLPDKEGRLQAVLDFPYEDFVKLYHLKEQLAGRERLPRYSISKLTISGSDAPSASLATRDSSETKEEQTKLLYAELTVQVELVAYDRDWVRIPLRLNQALLTKPAEYRGKGEAVVHYQPEGDGYVCWLRCPSNQPQELSLSMLVPLSAMGEQTRLRLRVPSAAISEMKFRTRQATAAGQVSEGAMLFPPVEFSRGGSEKEKVGQVGNLSNGTEWTIRGLRGDFEFRWRKAGPVVPDATLVLEAITNVVVRLDSSRVLSEASLTVRSYGAPCEGFRVRLPPGSKLVASSSASATVTAHIPDSPKNAAEGKRNSAEDVPYREVEVRLSRPTRLPVEVQLTTERTVDSERPPEWLELAGFEVPEAARQWGTVAVAAPPNSQIYWGAIDGARQIDAPGEALRVEGLVAAFEYASQPYALPVRLAPRRTRIHLEPEYVFYVQPDRVELDAKLSLTIRGAKVQSVPLLMPGWEFDDVGPENVAAVEGVECAASGRVTIPLRQPAGGALELRIRAHRPLSQVPGRIQFSLPQPLSATTGSAIVAIVPADNVELIPDGQALRGLIRQLTAPPLTLPLRQQEPLFYRSEGREAAFAAEIRLHSRRVEAQVFSRLQLQERQTLVEQRFQLLVAYEPLDQALFDVPEEAVTKELEFRLGEKPLTAKIVESDKSLPHHRESKVESRKSKVETQIPTLDSRLSTLDQQNALAKSAPRRVRMQVALPEAGIGLLEIRARYRLPPLNPRGETTHEANESRTGWQPVPQNVAVPLILPAEGILGEHWATVVAPPGLKIVPRDKAWQTVEGPDNNSFSPIPDIAPGVNPPASPAGDSPLLTAQKIGPPPESNRFPVLTLRADGRQDTLPLTVQREPAAGRGALLIERAWIQTWFSGDARQDRAVFQFSSNQKELTMQLPPGAAFSPPQVLLDGRPTVVYPKGTVPSSPAVQAGTPETTDSPPADGSSQVLIPLTAGGPWRRYVLEVQYHFSGPRPSPGRLRLEFPRLEEQTWIRRLYWQLVLPRYEHVFQNPPGFESENGWNFSGGAWFRSPLWSQAELESWSGASPAAPPDGFNAFLFSAMGDVSSGEVRTIDRAWLVFCASGAALALVLALIYWRAARRPVVLLLLGAALAVGIGLNPDPALLIAQTSVLGVLLGGGVAAWEWLFARKGKPSPAAGSVAGAAGGRGSSWISAPLPASSSGLSSTQTVRAADLPPAAAPPSEEPPP